MIEVLRDEDVAARLTPAGAVAAMRDAVLATHARVLAAPPRVWADLSADADDDARVIFTVGGRRGRWYGYRSYDTFGLPSDDQVTVLHDGTTGAVAGVAVSALLGRLRVGALGGLAVDALAAPDAGTLGLVGTGGQAFAQLWAIRAVRPLAEVVVYGRDPARRAAFVDRVVAELDLPARAASTAEEAVTGKGIVVLATSSGTPVIEAGWVAPGASVTTLGPKQQGRSEFDVALAERAELIVTDSVPQTRAYRPPFLLAGTGADRRLVGLGAVLTGDHPLPKDPAAVRLYCSVGLAGTEVALLAHLLGR
jgi:ornithine cyclodeaminase/alanine dehydrogenase-like protein (mu-crystallin family)